MLDYYGHLKKSLQIYLSRAIYIISFLGIQCIIAEVDKIYEFSMVDTFMHYFLYSFGQYVSLTP